MSDHIQRRDRRGASRSRSPARGDRHTHRTRSPHRHHRQHRRSLIKPEVHKELPYSARQLAKRDFTVFRPLFALYLDIQKQKVLDDLDEVEAKGRWKSFMGRWNRGELAEGWYDASTFQKAIASAEESMQIPRTSNAREPLGQPGKEAWREANPSKGEFGSSSDSNDSVGPALPGRESRSRISRVGPSIPNMEDLEFKREMEGEDMLARMADMRSKRKVDKKLQKEALEELVPRAEAGTFERRLEKKAEVNATMKSFRERSPGAAEIPESELMGGGDGISDFKRQKQEFERKKNERELRKEEVLRARAAEREERLEEYRAKEDKTMAMLKALAAQRFG